MLAILGLYNISHKEFITAYDEKDLYLNEVKNKKAHKENQPVAIIDIDDVIGSFREYFNNWLYEKYNFLIDPENTSYYSSNAIKDVGLSPEAVFETFIKENQLLNLPKINSMVNVIEYLRENNYYIQLLTSRPANNLKCKYQTYVWLNRNNIYYDNLAFAAEKFIWISKKDFYVNGDVKFAIDDSPKHAMEYATHDLTVFMPDLSYNKSARHSNIIIFDRDTVLDVIKSNINSCK